MFKPLKIIIPLFQVLIAMIAFILPKFNREFGLATLDLKDIVTKLNYPISLLWFLVLTSVESLTPYLPEFTGTWFALAALLIGLLVIASLAAFWYLVVREVELRRSGESMMRFRGALQEGIVLTLLFGLGASAAGYGYMAAHSLWHTAPRLAIVNGSILGCWAITLETVLFVDLQSFLRTNMQGPEMAGPPLPPHAE